MVVKEVKKGAQEEFDEIKINLEFWLSRQAHERVEAVEILRRQAHGISEGLQRFARVIERK